MPFSEILQKYRAICNQIDDLLFFSTPLLYTPFALSLLLPPPPCLYHSHDIATDKIKHKST